MPKLTDRCSLVRPHPRRNGEYRKVRNDSYLEKEILKKKTYGRPGLYEEEESGLVRIASSCSLLPVQLTSLNPCRTIPLLILSSTCVAGHEVPLSYFLPNVLTEIMYCRYGARQCQG